MKRNELFFLFSFQPIDGIVETCIKTPEDTKSNKRSKKNNNDTCQTSESSVITQCIRRHLVLNCPVWFKSDDCNKLMDFAKSCTKYPIQEGCGRKGKNEDKGTDGEDGKDGRKGKGGKDKKKNEKETKEENDDENDKDAE